MAQTTFSLTPGVALAGMVENLQDAEYDSCYLTEDGPVANASAAGLFVEYDPNDSSGKGVRFPQGTTTTMTLAGILAYDPTSEPSVASPGNLGGPWKKGMAVSVLRKGRIWAVKGGTAMPAVNAAPNVMHSSTTATDRGKVTGDATATTAGSEIQASGGGIVSKASRDATNNLVVLQLNLPA